MKRKHSPKAKGPSLLHRAASLHDESTVRRLLEQGEDPNQRDEVFGHTPLSGLVLGPPSGEAFAVAELLLEYGADVDAVGHRNRTPLYIAVESGWGGWVEWLMDHGADPNLKAPRRATPLELARRCGQKMVAMIERILEHRQVSQEISVIPSRDSQRTRL